MKYINQLNVALVLAGIAVVLYSFSETYWSADQSPPLQVERIAAPPPGGMESRSLAPPADLDRPRRGTNIDPDTGLPAVGDPVEQGSPAFPQGERQMPLRSPDSGRDTAGTQGGSLSAPTSRSIQNQELPQWNTDRSPPPGAESEPGNSSPVRIRRPGRTPFGQTVFPGAEGQKRQESQDPSPPPVRSSMPEQRIRR